MLLGMVLFGVATSVQASDSAPEERKESITRVEKTSSNNIHVDEIVIKNSNPATGDSLISDEEHKRLVSKLSIDAEKEVSNWATGQIMFGVIALFLGSIGGIWAFFSSTVERKIEKQVDKLDKKREEAIDATIKVKHEIDLAQETLKEFRKKENEINGKIEEFQNIILEKEREISGLNLNLDSIKDELESKVTTETFRLEQKNKVLRLVLKEVDGYEKYENQTIDKLIDDLNCSDEKTKYNAAELLPQFEIDSSKITDAFVATLKSSSDGTLDSLLLSGLSELRGDKNTLNYLFEASANLKNPNILA
ncbi:MAG: hypothetical protein C0512_16040, partial [Flavobacterium sp.]|nr:hypothetical protein [Flavobacterium sp.]